MAPEVLEGKGYDLASEWWAFGCLIYELLVGVPPFFLSNELQTGKNSRHNLHTLINTTSPKLDVKFIKEDVKDLLT